MASKLTDAQRRDRRALNRLAYASRELAMIAGYDSHTADRWRDAIIDGTASMASIEDAKRHLAERDAKRASVGAATGNAGNRASTPGRAKQKQHTPRLATSVSECAVCDTSAVVVMSSGDARLPPAVDAACVAGLPPADVVVSARGVEGVGVARGGGGVLLDSGRLRGSDDAGDIRWVMERLCEGEGCLEGAPSLTARNLWRWANRTPANNKAFVTEVYKAAFVSRAKEELEELGRRSLGDVGRAIEACLAVRQRVEAEMGEPKVVGQGDVR